MSINRRFPMLATNFVWVLLMCLLSLFGTTIADIQPKYELFDHLDNPTSIPFLNGKISMSCLGVNIDENKTDFKLINETAKTLNNESSLKIGEKYLLQIELIENRYICDGSYIAIMIGDLHCNPYSLKSEVSCTNEEWCLIGKNGKSKCAKKDRGNCILNENAYIYEKIFSLPKLHIACNKDRSIGNEGLCMAMSENKVVVAMSDDFQFCHTVGVLLLNSIGVKPDKVLLMPYNNDSWNVTYSKKVQISCKLMDERNVIDENKQFASVALIDSKVTSESQLPKKLKLTCLVNEYSTKMHFSHSTFLIIYDPDPPQRYAVITKSQHTNEMLSLTCSCFAPVEFSCGMTWGAPRRADELKIISGSSSNTIKRLGTDTEKNKPLSMKPQEKILYSWKHNKPRNYTCYTPVYASNIPNNFDLNEIPLAESVITETVTISTEDFVIQENASRPTNSDGDVEANAQSGANNVSSERNDSKSKLTALTALVAGCFVLVFILIIIVIFGMMKMRKISKKLEETNSMLSNAKGPKDSNKRTTGSFSTDQKRQSSPVEKKSIIEKKPKPPSTELTKVDSKFGLKARRN